MSTAYLDGTHAALYAVAWLTGALTIATAVAALLLVLLLVLDQPYRRAGARITLWRYTRAHRRSGRTPGAE